MMGVSLLILSRYLVIQGLGGFKVWAGIMNKLGLASGCSWSYFLVLPSSSSQSEDNVNLHGQSLPNGVHTVQYLEFSVTFVKALDEGGEGGDGVLSTNWLPCMETRFIDVLSVASMASWVRLLPVIDFQFNWLLVDEGSFCTLIFLSFTSLLTLVL